MWNPFRRNRVGMQSGKPAGEQPATPVERVPPADQPSTMDALARTFAAEPVDLLGMSRESLDAWENADVPSAGRESDRQEALADERQNPASSLNFPLHWTTLHESWTYLYDFALLCDLLTPRADDLILDFAAGTCWASELLLRLGMRPVSIDLSVEMLRRGRARLEADSRLVFRASAQFAAARGQSLPFKDDTFDGIVCMNALHHLPSFRDGLSEIYRVLKDGGRAVFSEPGTAHRDAPHSRFRMREESVIEKSVSLPAVYRIARECGFEQMNVVPLRSPGSYTFTYSSAAENAERLQLMWEETLKHSPKEHARFLLQKGHEPPQDTLMPAARLAGRLAANIAVLETTDTVPTGASLVDRVRVTNTGSVTWKARGRRFGGQVTAAVKICARDGTVLREDLGRTALPCDIAAGDSIEIALRIAAAIPPGDYIVKYDMVVEGVTWFEFHGSECPSRRLRVTS